MADIKISDLKIAGSDLFTDSENYLTELSEKELDFQGGLPIVTIAVASSEPCAIGISGGLALLAKRVLR